MKTVLTVMMIFTLLGCNADKASHTLSNTVDRVLIASSGNQAPKRFAFASPYRANGYVMQDEDYSFTMPLTKGEDWIKMMGWMGASDSQGTGLSLYARGEKIKYSNKISYGINIYSSIGKYGEDDKQREKLNKNYFKLKYPVRKLKNGYIVGINESIEHHGKENYICNVTELKNLKRGIYKKSYNCYKFNPTKTMYKKVGITLIYTKSPNLPAKYKSLAKEYTYQDLQNRAKRTLDSLYIKDGW